MEIRCGKLGQNGNNWCQLGAKWQNAVVISAKMEQVVSVRGKMATSGGNLGQNENKL